MVVNKKSVEDSHDKGVDMICIKPKMGCICDDCINRGINSLNLKALNRIKDNKPLLVGCTIVVFMSVAFYGGVLLVNSEGFLIVGLMSFFSLAYFFAGWLYGRG